LNSVLGAALLTTINTGQAKEDVFEALPDADGSIYTVFRPSWHRPANPRF